MPGRPGREGYSRSGRHGPLRDMTIMGTCAGSQIITIAPAHVGAELTGHVALSIHPIVGERRSYINKRYNGNSVGV